jgi:outer membrane cobalamin receptor
MRIRMLAASLVLVCVFVPIAAGQNQGEGDLANLSLEQLMKVQFYTASKHAQDTSDAPASVTIITKADIRTYGYRTLADVLQAVRGFWVNSDRNYSYLGVRGFARPGDYNTRVLLLVNGHRLNDNIDDGAMIGTEFPLDIALVERIEIVRGPGSSLYGTNALFGTINVITQQPTLAPTVEVSLDAATQFTGKARLTVGLPKLLDGALVSASVYDSAGNHRLYFPEFDSPEPNHGVAIDVDGDRNASTFALLRWKHFQLQSLFGSRRKVIPTASYGTIFNDPGTHTTNTAGFTELSYQRDFVDGLQLTSRMYYDGFVYRGTYAYAFDGVRVLALDNARSDSVGTETNISRPLGHRNVVTAGGELRCDLRQVQQDRLQSSPTLALNSHEQSRVFALYAQDEIRVTARLLVNAGVRFDRYSTFGSTVNPRVAAIFHADKKTAIKYSYGKSFRAPSAYELFYADGASQEASPGLRPERIASQTLGIERVLSPVFHVAAEAFSNSLSQMLDAQIDPANGMYHFVNVNSSNGKGLEFQFDAQHKGARAELSYTVQRSVDRQAREELANSPQHAVKLNARVPFPPALLAGFGLQYLSHQRTPGSLDIPDSLTVNLTISTRKPIFGFDLSASCYNVLNRRNYDPPSPSLLQTRLLQDTRGFRVQVTRRISGR